MVVSGVRIRQVERDQHERMMQCARGYPWYLISALAAMVQLIEDIVDNIYRKKKANFTSKATAGGGKETSKLFPAQNVRRRALVSGTVVLASRKAKDMVVYSTSICELEHKPHGNRRSAALP